MSLLLNNFFHYYILHELEQDFGEQLTSRYGRRYEKLYRKLTGKGWNDVDQPSECVPQRAITDLSRYTLNNERNGNYVSS